MPSVSTSSSSTKVLKKTSYKRKLVVVADPSVKEVDVEGEVVAIIVKKAKYEKRKTSFVMQTLKMKLKLRKRKNYSKTKVLFVKLKTTATTTTTHLI